TLVLALNQLVTMTLNGTLETFAKLASAVPCCEVPPTIVALVTLTLVRLRNAPAFVFTVLGPSPSFTAICKGVNGPFQMRNSSMVPFMPASPLNKERPSQEFWLLTLPMSIVVDSVLTSLSLA